MKRKTKKLWLTKITISKLDKNNMTSIKGGTQWIGCGADTQNMMDPRCNRSKKDC